jgi:manganese-dependent inorganic pyrophosphatase
VDAGPVLEHQGELREGLIALAAREGYDLAVLLVTDVTREGSHVMGTGTIEVAERALGVEGLAAGPVWVPGLLSRKQQVAAPIVEEALRAGGRP